MQSLFIRHIVRQRSRVHPTLGRGPGVLLPGALLSPSMEAGIWDSVCYEAVQQIFCNDDLCVLRSVDGLLWNLCIYVAIRNQLFLC